MHFTLLDWPNVVGTVPPNPAEVLFLSAHWQGTATASVIPAACLAATGLSTEPMFSWVDGTYSYGLYDLHNTPNAKSYDCTTVNNALSQG
jgi:hypothetical protein